MSAKLINVAAGNISATSTEAINGSQLYAVTSQLDKTNETAKTAASSASSAVSLASTAASAATSADGSGYQQL